MPTIVHFEIPSDDIERSKKFYSELFGWNIEKWPGLSEGMEYWLISTVDDKGNKALGGGMMKKQFWEDYSSCQQFQDRSLGLMGS
jgi:uncharacterized protein